MIIALNHMVAPRRSHGAFFDLARALGVTAVEIRNDLPNVALLDGTPAAAVGAAARARGLTILSINALQRFNDWTPARAAEARGLIAYAAGCRARALVLCPVNDPAFAPSEAERLAGLRAALRGLRPMLADAGITGLIEPLGFAECSLRRKSDAVDAIDGVDPRIFALVHDTFHHHVAGQDVMFPRHTGLVHVSGVSDPALAPAAMRDPHRGLVDRNDRIGNLAQLQRLRLGRYDGPVSFEPFAPAVHHSPDIVADLRRSIDFVIAGLRDESENDAPG
jgi:2-keto-myo-inositol isomerase